MPTARELLAQVDALMRRNRALEAAAAAGAAPVGAPAADRAAAVAAGDEVPVLTEAVAAAADAQAAPLRRDAPAAADEIPLLTEAVAPPRPDSLSAARLREQLAARLQPVVDRARDELVATLAREAAQLLQALVAEAVEREVDRRRDGG